MDAIAAFADHVVRTGFQDLPGDAVKAAKTFILDTLGVGMAGSSGSHGERACRDAGDVGTWRGSPRLGQRQASAGAGGGHVQCLSGAQLGVRLRARGSCRACHDRGAAGGDRRRRAKERCQRHGAHCRSDAGRRRGGRSRRRRHDGVAVLPAGDGGRVWRHRSARQAHGSRSAGHDQCILDRLRPVLRHDAGA